MAVDLGGDGRAMSARLNGPGGVVRLSCQDGHEWDEAVESAQAITCTHWTPSKESVDAYMAALKDGKPAAIPGNRQVDLVCRECGAGYSVVGDPSGVKCPRCRADGRTNDMHCTRCLAGMPEGEAKVARCPTCGHLPVRVVGKTRVTFRGDVAKTVVSGG